MDTLATRIFRAAEEEVEAVLESFPPEIKEVCNAVAICIEARVPQGLIDEGIERDTLGLFSGDTVNQPGSGDAPPTIHLFIVPIWDYAGHRMRSFREEVKVTLLHELGHYLALEEDDLRKRHLD